MDTGKLPKAFHTRTTACHRPTVPSKPTRCSLIPAPCHHIYPSKSPLSASPSLVLAWAARQEGSCSFLRRGQSSPSMFLQAHLLTCTKHGKLRTHTALNPGPLSAPMCVPSTYMGGGEKQATASLFKSPQKHHLQRKPARGQSVLSHHWTLLSLSLAHTSHQLL